MKKNGIFLPSVDEIERTNKKLERGSTADKGKIDFLLAKIKAKKLSGNLKVDIVGIAVILWYDIITNHPFTDGNKRTATETMLSFLELNGFMLQGTKNSLVYISLKIANKDITFSELTKWIENRLVKIK